MEEVVLHTGLTTDTIKALFVIFYMVSFFVCCAVILMCARVIVASLRNIFSPSVTNGDLKRQNTKILEQMEELKKEVSSLNKEELMTQRTALVDGMNALYNYYESRAEEDKVRRILLEIEKGINELRKKMDKITGEYSFEKYVYDRDRFGGDLSKMKLPTDELTMN